MPVDLHGQWYPPMSPKQLEVYSDNRKHILLSGPRLCGKTLAACHRVIKHAWQHESDRVGIFVRTTKLGKLGVWDDLLSYALPIWSGEGNPDDPDYDPGLKEEGFRVVASGVDGSTRMAYIRITNCHGGLSELQLHSLSCDDNVTEKLKGSRFGALFFDELDNHDNEEVFRVSTLQLRQINLPESRHLFIATTNPAGDTGHWVYQTWWVAPNDPTRDERYRKSFGLHEFKLSDNPYLHQDTLTKLRETYRNDPALYDRYVNGLWVPDTRTTHFAGAFREGLHVLGDKENNILPSEHCSEVLVGWDLGDSNNAIIFMEHVTNTAGNDYWAVLDEIVHIGEHISVEELTYEVLETMEALEKYLGRRVAFKHWSDRSAFDRYRSAADARDHILVNQFSKGKIQLIGCPKPPHSVKARVALVRQLLVGDKIYVSHHCERIISMFKRLSKGKTKGETIKRDAHIHPFDAMSYAIYGESISELENSLRPDIGNRATGLVSITP